MDATHHITSPVVIRGNAASDVVLMQRSLSDPAVFQVIWDRYHQVIGRYIASRIGAERTEDVLVATFLAAFESRDRYDAPRSGGSAKPWLLGIATNQLSRHFAAEQRWLRQQAASSLPAYASANGSALDAEIEAINARGHVGNALSSLPAEQRDPFLLAVLGDLDYSEISVALEIPVGTVRSRISRARQSLKRCMKGANHV